MRAEHVVSRVFSVQYTSEAQRLQTRRADRLLPPLAASVGRPHGDRPAHRLARACGRFPLEGRQRLPTPLGDATAQGVHDGLPGVKV